MRAQRVAGGGAQSLRLRVGAFLCVLLVAVAGVAQAAHVHGQWLPSSKAQIAAHTANSDGISEDACPLCMAMHSALPGTGFAAVRPGLLAASVLLSGVSRKPERLWYFAAFSRPPPRRIYL